MILDTTNISSGTAGTVVVEKWVWEWYQDALGIAKSQLAKLEVETKSLWQENKELRERVDAQDAYKQGLLKAFQDKCVENRRLAEENLRLHERVEELANECNRLTDDVDKHWEYLEDVILGMVESSDRVRQVAQEIKTSRGIA